MLLTVMAGSLVSAPAFAQTEPAQDHSQHQNAPAPKQKPEAAPADPHAGHHPGSSSGDAKPMPEMSQPEPQNGQPQDGQMGPMDHSHHMEMQDEGHHSMPGMAGMENMDHSGMNRASMFLMGESTGTGYQPAAWPMPMLMNKIGDWHLMWMGQAFLVDTQQSGPRGGDKLYSPNWGMLGATHRLGKGALMLRSMLSLDPATVTDRRYPLLFQTGETAFGRAIVDGQHPHDFVMELSVQYAQSFGEKGVWNVYYAPVGDPALGPVAYPHRASALELPQAAISHHWQDATHIANNVLTAGVSYDKVRLEASGFSGREPGENRWNIDWARMDSWSTRLSVFPTRRWMAQASVGRLKRPEALHADDVVRATGSLHYIVPKEGGNAWASSLIWGRNYKTVEKHASHSVTAETVVPFKRLNFITGRFEWSQRDELFENDHETGERIEQLTGKHAFNVAAFTAGYTRDIPLFRNVQTGLGANFSIYAIDSALKPYYGDVPVGVNVFLRIRLRSGG